MSIFPQVILFHTSICIGYTNILSLYTQIKIMVAIKNFSMLKKKKTKEINII